MTQLIKSAAWKSEHQSQYECKFRFYYQKHYQNLEVQSTAQFNTRINISAHLSLEAAVYLQQQSSNKKLKAAESEVTVWLQTAVMKDHNILNKWRLQEKSKLIMTQFTKNILAISVAKVSVKWLFNMVCDVCHYWWNQLNAEIIQHTMLIKHHDFHLYISFVKKDTNSDTDLNLEWDSSLIDELSNDQECQPTIILSDKDSSDSHILNDDDFNDHILLEESVRNQSDLNDDDLFDTRSVITQSAIVESIIIRLFDNELIRT